MASNNHKQRIEIPNIYKYDLFYQPHHLLYSLLCTPCVTLRSSGDLETEKTKYSLLEDSTATLRGVCVSMCTCVCVCVCVCVKCMYMYMYVHPIAGILVRFLIFVNWRIFYNPKI